MRRIGIDARKLGDGGIGRYVGELLIALPEAAPDDEFVAVVRAQDERAMRRFVPRVEVVPARSTTYSLREHWELAGIARDLDLDLFHATHYVLPRGLPCPSVVTVHDLIHWRLPRTPLHRWYCRLMLGEVRRRAAVILAPAAAVARDLTDLAGVDPDRIRVVPNGLTWHFGDDEMVNEAEIGAFRRRLGLVGPYVVHVSNGLPHKGLDVLLEALGGLEELAVLIAGQGSDRPSVIRQVEAAGLDESRVYLLGGVSERELMLAYRGAAVAAVPSLLEGFGLPALEAMACGVPVVASDGGGLPEVVGDTGVLVPAGDVASLRGALYRIAFEIDPTERQNLIERGRERSRRFSWDRTARATLGAYDAALGAAG